MVYDVISNRFGDASETNGRLFRSNHVTLNKLTAAKTEALELGKFRLYLPVSKGKPVNTPG